MNPPKISVIIPTYNRAAMVCDCVRSVLESDYEPLEVVVVDDCSPDDTQERLRAAFGDRIVFLRNAENRSLAVSRNNGARVATGDYLFFLDDDNVVEKGILTELQAVYHRHPKAGVVAPMAVHQMPGRENLIWTLGSDFGRWTSLPKGEHHNIPLSALPPDHPAEYPTTYSPNAFMVTREAFMRVGGMDESLVITYEESDFGWKVMEAGYENYIAARAVTKHYGCVETGCVAELRALGIERTKRAYHFARNRVRFARRHFAWYQALVVAVVFAPLSAVWYGRVALRNNRPDIAWAYLKGTVRGILGLT